MRIIVLACFFSLSALAASNTFSFSFHTTKGEMKFDCPAEWSPRGATRLQELITAGFFTDIAFFRVVSGFVAQFGISGDPKIAAKWEKQIIPDDPVKTSNVAGTLTYATDGPNTRTTQLFINLVDNARLDKLGFSPVCKMSDMKSLEVAKSLYSGYGDGPPKGKGPDQDLITQQGNEYLKKNYPLLDYLRKAEPGREFPAQ